MYFIAIMLQYIGIISTVIGFYVVFPQRISKRKQLLILILMSVFINEVGYLLELQSDSMEAALVSIKVAYVGKLIAELAILIFVFEYTKYHIPTWIKCVLGLLHTYVLSLIWTCETNPLYYSEIDFTTEGLYPHVILGHGIVYNVFTVLTFSYMVLIGAVCIVQVVRAKNRVQRARMLCLCTPPITFVLGLLIFRSGITQGYDTTAISYLISSIVFVFTIVKYDLVEEAEIVKEMMLDEFSEAVIVYNQDGKIFYVNHQFEMVFPDYLTNQEINKKIIECGKTNEEFPYKDEYYRVMSKDIVQESTQVGTLYILHNNTEEHRHIDLVNNYNRDLKRDVEEKTRSILEIQNQFVLGMADMVEGRDANTGGHIKRTSQVIQILINKMREDEQLQLEDAFCDCVIKAAPMHDLGKITVDDAILRKPGRFTQDEYEQMKKHAEKGAEIVGHILESIDDRYFVKIAENVAHYHHERVDGTGYPEHLVGDAIPFEARIMAIADVYDALVSKRCYKDSMSFDEAFAIIMEGMGTQFDRRLERYFIACRAELESYYKKMLTD